MLAQESEPYFGAHVTAREFGRGGRGRFVESL